MDRSKSIIKFYYSVSRRRWWNRRSTRKYSRCFPYIFWTGCIVFAGFIKISVGVNKSNLCDIKIDYKTFNALENNLIGFYFLSFKFNKLYKYPFIKIVLKSSITCYQKVWSKNINIKRICILRKNQKKHSKQTFFQYPPQIVAHQ